MGQVVDGEARAVGRIAFRGHPMVRSLHPTTIEITTEDNLTERGDCIVGVGAERGCSGLDERVKTAIRNENASIKFRILVDADIFEFSGRGDPRLSLAHAHDIVIRRSRFISERTIAVGADAAAKDIPRSIVARLRSPDARGFLELEVV
ncbi:MAG: DUF371 domain-containing protein [Thaumarchaeota archaeon]|nr:DUF371 domain-containing protein [Nitrososphaerota archaeon]